MAVGHKKSSAKDFSVVSEFHLYNNTTHQWQFLPSRKKFDLRGSIYLDKIIFNSQSYFANKFWNEYFYKRMFRIDILILKIVDAPNNNG